jgi:hypothetical protein
MQTQVKQAPFTAQYITKTNEGYGFLPRGSHDSLVDSARSLMSATGTIPAIAA